MKKFNLVEGSFFATKLSIFNFDEKGKACLPFRCWLVIQIFHLVGHWEDREIPESPLSWPSEYKPLFREIQIPNTKKDTNTNTCRCFRDIHLSL